MTNLGGFTDTYAISNLLPYQKTPGGFIDMDLYKGSVVTWTERQTINHVPVHIDTREALVTAADDSSTDGEPLDGDMDDLNRDGKIDFKDAAVLYELIDNMFGESWYNVVRGRSGPVPKDTQPGPFCACRYERVSSSMG